MTSYAPEVQADETGRWYGNAVRFATEEEARSWGADRALRWNMVKDWRAVESDDPVNYQWTRDGLVRIDEEVDKGEPQP